MPLPTVQIMQPTLLSRPFHHEGWVYEEKVDGYRMVAYKSGGMVRLVSRNGLDHTQRFPGITEAIRRIPEATLILDGEVAVYDQRLVSRFEWMRHHAPPELATPPLFMAFDVLRCGTTRSGSSRCAESFATTMLAGRIS